MATLTDATIKAAMREGKQRRLADGKGRGSGRLVLVIKPTAAGASASWYAQQWKNGKRQTTQIGRYPDISLAKARSLFATDYAAAIATGAAISEATLGKPGTVADLFAGYVASLRQRGASSADEVEQRLGYVAKKLGAGKPAREITAGDVVAYLRPIFSRGAKALADHDRSYIRAAFGWGLRSEHDYRSTTVYRRFGMTANPAADIPPEPKTVGTRWLSAEEFVEVYRWLERPDSTVTSTYTVAVQLMMLTGQRPGEILALTPSSWDSQERVLSWPKTKNGQPHSVPVCSRAAALLDGIEAAGPWLFPSAMDRGKPASVGTVYCSLWRVRQRMTVDKFTLRDLRRTWKTLSGQAGLTKEDRDRLQNHARHDVSSRHYDRYEYLAEKRAAIARWDDWVERQLGSSADIDALPVEAPVGFRLAG